MKKKANFCLVYALFTLGDCRPGWRKPEGVGIPRPYLLSLIPKLGEKELMNHFVGASLSVGAPVAWACISFECGKAKEGVATGVPPLQCREEVREKRYHHEQ